MRAVLFDLDGTLIDSLSDIAGALNHVLGERDLPQHTLADYRIMVGDGASELVRRALPPWKGELHADMLARYRDRYRANLVVESRPYPGIEELLETLEKRGVEKAVITNKPHAPAVELVERLLGRFEWASIRGQREGVPHKPDPTMALEIARAIGIEPRECILLGDTHTDMETATAAKMMPIGCLWGYRDRKELIEGGAVQVIAHPRDLLPLIA